MSNAAEKRRKAARKKPARPAKYQYDGLEERTTVMMPEGVDAGQSATSSART